jgi:hypothetical protein
VVGTWKFLYSESYADDGEITRGFGDHPKGFMIYTDDGVTLCILMRSGRKRFPGEDNSSINATLEEKAEAFDSAISHAGTWEVLDGKIIHHLTANTFPNWTDTHQVREFDISDTHLTLHPPRMLLGGKMRYGRVFWERMGSDTCVPLAPPFGDLRVPAEGTAGG